MHCGYFEALKALPDQLKKQVIKINKNIKNKMFRIHQLMC